MASAYFKVITNYGGNRKEWRTYGGNSTNVRSLYRKYLNSSYTDILSTYHPNMSREEYDTMSLELFGISSDMEAYDKLVEERLERKRRGYIKVYGGEHMVSGMKVKFNVDSYEYLKRDTVYNRILRAMLDGKESIIIDNEENNITRCVDEEMDMEELQDELTSLGFVVKRLYTNNGYSFDDINDLDPTNSFIVKWGDRVYE